MIEIDFELDHAIDALRENARVLANDKDEYFKADILNVLKLLTNDIMPVFNGTKFDEARDIGDLDDTSGIAHLFSDYPPTVPDGRFFPVAFLNTFEEAAANALYAIYFASDEVESGDLSESAIEKVRNRVAFFLGMRADIRRQELEEKERNRTVNARKNANRSVEQRRDRIKEIAMYKYSWQPGQAIIPADRKELRRILRSTYPEYKQVKDRQINEDFKLIGLNTQQS